MKRVFIVHGWEGNPQEGWFPWLKRELEKRGVQVTVPPMPNAAEPRIETWISHLSKVVGEPDEETYFIGHSIGVQTILRYLETIDKKIGGVVAVAGFYTLNPDSISDEEDKAIAKPWLERPINNDRVKGNTNNITAIFSDNDPDVGIENESMFKERLGAKTIVLHAKGHFSGSENVPELPTVLNELLEMMK